jgi:hypothetical protein
MSLQSLHRILFAQPSETYSSYENKSLMDVNIEKIVRQWKNSLNQGVMWSHLAIAGFPVGFVVCAFSGGFSNTLLLGTTILTSSFVLGFLSQKNNTIAIKEINSWSPHLEKQKILDENKYILKFANSVNTEFQNLGVFLADFFERGKTVFKEVKHKTHYETVFYLLNERYEEYIKEVKSYKQYLTLTESTIKTTILDEREDFKKHLEELSGIIPNCIKADYAQFTNGEFKKCEEYIHKKKNEVLHYEVGYAVYLYPLIISFVDEMKTSAYFSLPEIKKFICPVMVEIDKLRYDFKVIYNPHCGVSEEVFFQTVNQIAETFTCVEN